MQVSPANNGISQESDQDRLVPEDEVVDHETHGTDAIRILS
jgi:hypothetical protein